jgi:hypothetical protein
MVITVGLHYQTLFSLCTKRVSHAASGTPAGQCHSMHNNECGDHVDYPFSPNILLQKSLFKFINGYFYRLLQAYHC